MNNKNMPTDEQFANIFVFHQTFHERLTSHENNQLEFKESFNWGSRTSYVKCMAAFANNKGGCLVFGVKDSPRELVGLANNSFETFDEARITTYLNSVFSPEIIFEKIVLPVHSKNVGILKVYQSQNKPVICLRNEGNGSDLREADIYYRYNAKNEKIKCTELRILMDHIREDERRAWMKHFEKISKIGPTNSAIFNTVDGNITGSGGTLVIDEKLIPKLRFISAGTFREGGQPVLKLIGDVRPLPIVVNKDFNKTTGIRITNDPKAPLVRIDEDELIRKQFSLDYTKLCSELSLRYPNFLINKKFHDIRKELMKDSNLCHVRYLDQEKPNSANKAFYSSLIIEEFDKHYIKKKV